MRCDIYLFKFGYLKSRQKAKDLIEKGNVKIDSAVVNKPSFEIDEAVEHHVEIIDDCPYVSRGGLKLEKMLNELQLNLENKIAIDIGASTGGFTHCLILNGVEKVFAVDSGTNQLDELLLNDNRVVSIEGYNARNLKVTDIGAPVDIITVDVSFISQEYIIPVAKDLLKEDGIYIGLIKPQFEVGKSKLGKNGIVKDKKYRHEAIKKICDCAYLNGFGVLSIIESPIQGGDGNIEYIAALTNKKNNNFDVNLYIKNKGLK